MHKKAISVLLSASLLFAGATTALKAEEKKPEGKIIYVYTDEQQRTYLSSINADGKENQLILNQPLNNICFPRYCAKKGWIGFTNKTAEMESEIYIMAKDHAKRILTGANLEDFSPDGKFLLYTTADGDASLYAYNIENGRAIKLSDKHKVISARWAPNSEWIVASVMTDEGTSDIYLFSLLGQGIQRVTASEAENEMFPCFTADSQKILYTTDRYGTYEMEYLSLANKPDIYRPCVHGIFPVLSPDSEWMAYESNGKILVADKTGYDPQVIARGKTPLWIEK